jgi:trans-aconitate methyltransferase
MSVQDDQIFDSYALDYDAALARGISVSGEDKYYFAERRLQWLLSCLVPLAATPRRIMDFGCGTGSSTPLFLNIPSVEYFLGADSSPEIVKIARQAHSSSRAQFYLLGEYQPAGEIDLVYSNGVFHHIAPDKRSAALDFIHRSLCPGGLLAFWENNPWNPGTRYVMSRISFDRNAIKVSSLQARRLLEAAGFEILRTDYLFIFPRFLRWCRRIEPLCSRLPLGAQYQVLCRKPLA